VRRCRLPRSRVTPLRRFSRFADVRLEARRFTPSAARSPYVLLRRYFEQVVREELTMRALTMQRQRRSIMPPPRLRAYANMPRYVALLMAARQRSAPRATSLQQPLRYAPPLYYDVCFAGYRCTPPYGHDA